MESLLVVDDPAAWPLDLPGVSLVRAADYLTDQQFAARRKVRVFNLCRSYKYQSTGYYVSLLADARGHSPQPSVGTMQDFRLSSILRELPAELDELVQKSLHRLTSDSFTLSIYFGHNLARCYDRLSQALFGLFRSPLMQGHFVRGVRDSRWYLQSLHPLPLSEVPESHRDFLLDQARDYFARRSRPSGRTHRTGRFNLAILVNPQEKASPSNPRAIKRFLRAARALQLEARLIGREDFSSLAEYDALLIRETTHVNHYTYRFARKAAAEGLVVLDDPESILRCTNKVFLTELLDRNKVPQPKTLIVHKGNRKAVEAAIGLPCILKQPDSAFSQGVIKVETAPQLQEELTKLLVKSDLVLAQEFLPTDFDWRIGVLDGQPLFACRYWMAKKHWQIVRWDGSRLADMGNADCLPLEQVPPEVMKTALKAARLVGTGLYGVDLKQAGKRVVVMEVNDNPNIDAGCEDVVLKDELYLRILRTMIGRLEQRTAGSPT